MQMESIKSYVLNNANIGITVIDSNASIIYINKAILKFLGMESSQVIGRNILDIYSELDENTSVFIKSLRTGNTFDGLSKVLMDCNNGEIKFIRATYMPIFQDSKIVGAVEYIDFNQGNNEKTEVCSTAKNVDGYNFVDFLTIEKELIQLIEKIKEMSSYNYNALIIGETGCGKEIIAQSIHNNSPRRDKPFIAQNCAAIPENLLEAIFFGTEKGSFTGAINKQGLFEIANGGTLLLDELNSLPIYLQAKLLRVLQEGYIRRVGGTKDIQVDVRVISTINEDLEILRDEKRIREDLFYRLGPIYINIPPLRERKSDIDYLFRIFMKRESKLLRIDEPIVSKETKNFLREYHWPGNVREMKNAVSHILLNSKDVVQLEDLPYYMMNTYTIPRVNNLESGRYQTKLIEYEKTIINEALKTAKGNVSEASRLLGIKRQTLQYKIKRWQIE